jgi:hypothetical protein
MIALERLQFFQQRIELSVGNFWRLIDVVQIFVTPNQLAKLENSSGRIHGGTNKQQLTTNNYRSRASM